MDRAWATARRIQCFSGLWQSPRTSSRILHHTNLCQRGKPTLRLRSGKLAKGYPLGWHDADSRLDPVELFLPRDEHGAALDAVALLASCRGDGCGDRWRDASGTWHLRLQYPVS